MILSPHWRSRQIRFGALVKVGLRLAVVVAPLCLTACQPAVLDPQGPVGLAERTILIDSLIIMLAIVAPTILLALGVGWWFRKSNTRARYLPEWAYSGQLELLIWAIPLLVIMLLSGVSWIGSHELDPAKKLTSSTPEMDVQVVSLDWKWLFIYPAQHIASVNELVVPAGTPIHFTLTSASVMNAFFIPQLGSMIYTMNGMTDQLNLQADKPGTYLGMSSHYSGDGFAGMRFDLRAVPAAEFQSWVAETHTKGATLDESSYAQLARQSMDVKPFSFRDVDQDLFQRIVSQQVPPGPGPQTGQGGVDVTPHSEHR